MTNTIEPIFSNEEFLTILNELNDHHALFYRLWLMGKPQFTNKIKTAAVSFNKEGGLLNFMVNYDFWQTLTLYQKGFVICHECTHITLNHGLRANGKIDNIKNKTMDVVVNHSLVDFFGFDRKLFDPENKYCWIDTVYSDPNSIKKNESFEYYYLKLKNDPQSCSNENKGEGGGSGEKSDSSDESENSDSSNGNGGGGELVDGHEGFEDFSDVLKEVAESLTEEEKESLADFLNQNIPKNNKQAGDGEGGIEYLVAHRKPKPKKKWETIIKKWASKYLRENYTSYEQWIRRNPKLRLMNSSYFLPYEVNRNEIAYGANRITVEFYSDTSGSCVSYMDRFFDAAASLPVDRFDVRLYCFDTAVYETSLKSRKLYGMGGTTFNMIETHIQNRIKKSGEKYPLAVFVVSDGENADGMLKCEKPKNWYWFLTPTGNSRTIPKESNIFKLENFE